MKELSLLETLERAHLLSEIQDPSPMVEYSVYRFLIVFLMDMLRPEDEEVLEELLDEGQFDRDTIQRYVRQCEQEGVSFDLFQSGHFYRPNIVQIGIEIQNRSPHWITLSQMETTTSISITSGRRSLTRPAKRCG